MADLSIITLPNGASYNLKDKSARDSLAEAMINRGTVDNTTDFNTLTASGCYKVQMGSWGDAAANHSPNEYGNIYSYGLLFVLKPNAQQNENRILQIYFPYSQDESSDPVVTRMHNGTTLNFGWKTWHRMSYNTWRGIQNNLASDSTTESLSAAQGKALKALVDGKAGTATATQSANGLMSAADKKKLDEMKGSSARIMPNKLSDIFSIL